MVQVWLHRLLLVLFATLTLTGCREQPTRWDTAEQETRGRQAPATVEQSVSGGELNRFFPAVEAPWDIVFKQEKQGFAQASLQREGQELSVLSISDTTNNPDAREKFTGSNQQFNGYPRAAVGSKGTAILVGDRYQVQVRSMDPLFGEPERLEWLGKFDLRSLSNL
jgi:hypothetical protein